MKTVTVAYLEGTRTLNTAPVMVTYEANNGYYHKIPTERWAIGIDGNTYIFEEDPNDGYRSYLKDVIMYEGLTEHIKGATTINRKVMITGIYDGCELIEIVDFETGHTWARIGTENTDDYYPYCVMSWNPMNPSTQIVNPKEIPIEAAKEIAENYGYDQVVIYARKVNSVEHMTTYGTTKTHCNIAAKMGEVLKKFMGWDV